MKTIRSQFSIIYRCKVKFGIVMLLMVFSTVVAYGVFGIDTAVQPVVIEDSSGDQETHLSVNKDLRDLEKQRLKLQLDSSSYSKTIDQYKFEQTRLKKELQQIRFSLEQAKSLLVSYANKQCRMTSCFDFTHCSLASGFPVYFYDPKKYFIEGVDVDHTVKSKFSEFLVKSDYTTQDPSTACIFVVLLGELKSTKSVNEKDLESFLISLPYWKGEGKNHVLINIGRTLDNRDLFQGVNTGQAMLAQSSFEHSSFRHNFDVLIPLITTSTPVNEVWKELSPISPLRRKFIMSFWGQYFSGKPKNHVLSIADSLHFNSLDSFYSHIQQSIKDFQINHPDKFQIEPSCETPSSNLSSWLSIVPSDWLLCSTTKARHELIKLSTFNLIIPPLNDSIHSTISFQTRVVESLKNGAVPVILGSYNQLPFSDVIQWSTVAIVLHFPRIKEIPFVLQSIADEDIASFRLQGRHIYLNYFSSVHAILDSTLAVIRTRLQIPAKPIQEEKFTSIFPTGFVPLKENVTNSKDKKPKEHPGPVESPFPSDTYEQNFTQTFHFNGFNHMGGDLFHIYPSTPFQPLLPPEAKFIRSISESRPAGTSDSSKGYGKTFSRALDGNYPKEQFTIVILTYNRLRLVMKILRQLKGLAYLNKVLLVWNDPKPPAKDLKWPDIGVPIEVAKTNRNSLNNRFLPYDVIETDAILSLDDDMFLTNADIVLGFRVWREHRSQMVGFPARFHAWDKKTRSWQYGASQSCEISMVLTSAAFFHKYYAYQYSYVMPQAIRDHVDKYMNCEDIAINFLVSHITRKPPIKAADKWLFTCPECSKRLSGDMMHYKERSECLNYFEKVYGYMPLLNTKHKVNSLFQNTWDPSGKHACLPIDVLSYREKER